MLNLSFQQQVVAEQIRAIEEQCGPLPGSTDARADNFGLWLAARNTALLNHASTAAAVHQAPHLYQRLLWLLWALAALLGGATSVNALSHSQGQLNLFWVLGVLLGLSWLSLLLWLALSCLPGRRQPGLIAPLLQPLLRRLLPQQASPEHAAGRAWMATLLRPPQGLWRLGRLTHSLWAAYLLGGLLSLTLLFSTRQFDFIWESTLLGGDSFVRLSHYLSAPLAHLGWPVPDASQVLASQLGPTSPADLADKATTRRAWGWFILGCILLYGLLPRLVAWLLCRLLEWRAQRRFALDINLPYYVQLQRQLWLSASAGSVIDADPAPPPSRAHIDPTTPKPVPPQALWLGLELPAIPAQPQVLININDTPSLNQAEQTLSRLQGPVALLIDGLKAADRGLIRQVRQLTRQRSAAEWWLVLDNTQPIPDSRWQTWLEATQQLGLHADHLLPLHAEGQ